VVELGALFLSLVSTALAVRVTIFLYKAEKRLFCLENPELPLNPGRFATSPEVVESVFLPETVSEMDVVGAWALEEERAGRPVSLETMQMQRRMWLEA